MSSSSGYTVTTIFIDPPGLPRFLPPVTLVACATLLRPTVEANRPPDGPRDQPPAKHPTFAPPQQRHGASSEPSLVATFRPLCTSTSPTPRSAPDGSCHKRCP